jgi:glycosyltransferase involved in cell wall biosynthesis
LPGHARDETVSPDPLVSVIITFRNTPVAFFREAVESVRAQSYQDWELLLVDDGSFDDSTAVARWYANESAGTIRYLEHAGHENCGMSLSRQLGIASARGAYVAFLDSDDVWLPNKLSEQVAIMNAHPDAGMIYGNTLYWSTWSEGTSHADFIPRLGVTPNRVAHPPTLLPLFLSGRAAVPCTCSVLVRKSALALSGGFEGRFRHLYEDQAFYAKMCLELPVYVSDRCWDKYRQHPHSATAQAGAVRERAARIEYLEWLRDYLVQRGRTEGDVWKAVRRELWLAGLSPRTRRVLKPLRRLLAAATHRAGPARSHDGR